MSAYHELNLYKRNIIILTEVRVSGKIKSLYVIA